MAVKTYKWNDKTQLTPHFNVQEFRCKCGKQHDILIDEKLPATLEMLFDVLDCSMITINSGHRCASHDKAVGGSGCGFHVSGQAADIRCYDKKKALISSKIVSCYAQEVGFGGIANIDTSYQNTHVDVRPSGFWYGNEVVTTAASVCSDFWKYYDIEKPEAQIDRVIRKGDRGADVELMQARLHALGYLRKTEIDGDFGRITLGAVCAFQLEHGLDVNGIVGQETKAALNG